jgi:hypothetical protein
LYCGPRLGLERCGKINALNAGAESWTGIGVLAACVACELMVYWPRVQRVDSPS